MPVTTPPAGHKPAETVGIRPSDLRSSQVAPLRLRPERPEIPPSCDGHHSGASQGELIHTQN